MTKTQNTQTTPATTAGPDVTAASAQFLTPIVLGLQALAVNGKQAHWNVRGANFIAIHELLDTLVANAQASADLAAERIVALGLPIDARVSTIADKTPKTAVPAGFTQWETLIRDVISDMDQVIADTEAAIDGLDEFDQTSQDVAIAIKAGLDKDRWFLFAHLAE